MTRLNSMVFLERRIPPPIVFLISAAFIYFTAREAGFVLLPELLRDFFGTAFFLLGAVLIMRAFLLFRKKGTTLSPNRRAIETSLITEGVFSYSRNPIYLGMFIMLMSFSLFTGSLNTLLGPGFFLFFIDRFQIGAEEAALEERFGESFLRYKSRTRRWFGRTSKAL